MPRRKKTTTFDFSGAKLDGVTIDGVDSTADELIRGKDKSKVRLSNIRHRPKGRHNG